MSIQTDILTHPFVQSLPNPLKPERRWLNTLVLKSPEHALSSHMDEARLSKVAFVVKTVAFTVLNIIGFILNPFLGLMMLPLTLHFCRKSRDSMNDGVDYHVTRGTIEKGVLQELKTIEYYTDKQMETLLDEHQILKEEIDLAPLRQIDPDLSEIHLLKPIVARMIYWKRRANVEKMELFKLNRADSKTLTWSHLYLFEKFRQSKSIYQYLTKLIKYPTYGSEWNQRA